MKLKLFLVLYLFTIFQQYRFEQEVTDKIEEGTIEELAYPSSNQLPNKKYNPQNVSIQQPNSFNFQKLKKQFEDFDCIQKYKDDSLAKQHCLNKLEQMIFHPLEDVNSSNEEIYNHINSMIFIPLAYNSVKRVSFANIIKEVLFKTESDNLLTGLDLDLNFDDFQYSVIENLKRVENKSDFNTENQKEVTDGVVNILRDFHVYWNALRLKNQVEKASGDTLKVVENLIKQYSVKENFMFQITKMLVLKIQEAYQRFIKAHQTLKILKGKAPQILVNQIINRYLGLLEVYSQTSEENLQDGFLVNQFSIITDFTKIYLMNLYKEKFSVQEIKQKFEDEIIQELQQRYNSFILKYSGLSDEKKRITGITAVIILKLKHIHFIFFNYNDINEILNIEVTQMNPMKSLTVRFYYEFMDNMILLPGKCVDSMDLEICIYKHANKIFNYLAEKYSLKNSQSGQILYRYVRKLLQDIFKDASEEEISNLNLFKKFYYKKLFSKLFEYKIRFKIKDTMELDDLETEIGDMLMAYKLNTDNELVHINYKVLDQLDLAVYDKFLSIKAQFDDFVPIYQDKLAILEVVDIFNQFIDNFENEYQKVIDDKFKVLINDLKKLVENWKEKMLIEYQKEHKRPELQDQIVQKYPELFNLDTDSYKINHSAENKIHYILGKHETTRDQKEQKDQEIKKKKEKESSMKPTNEIKDEQDNFVSYNLKPFDELKKNKNLKPLNFDYKKPTNMHVIYNGIQKVLGDSHSGSDNIPSNIQHADVVDDYELNPEHTVINDASSGDVGLQNTINLENTNYVQL